MFYQKVSWLQAKWSKDNWSLEVVQVDFLSELQMVVQSDIGTTTICLTMGSTEAGKEDHIGKWCRYRLGTRRSPGRTPGLCHWYMSCQRRLWKVSEIHNDRQQRTYKYQHQRSMGQRLWCMRSQVPYGLVESLGTDQAQAGCYMLWHRWGSCLGYIP